jgi:ABC-type amino acid transport substrate-binding protein
MNRNVRRLVTAVTLAASLTLVAACGSQDKSGSDDSAGGKTLVVGTDPTYKPFGFKKDGQLQGVDADVAHAIAKELGMKLDLKPVAFDGVIPSIQSGRLDAYMDINITPERAKKVSFTKPYITQYLTSVVRADDTTSNPTLDDLKKMKVGVASSTAAASWAQANGLNVQTYQDVDGAYQDLILGRVGAVVVETLNAGYYASHVFPGKLRVSSQTLGDDQAVQIAAIYAQGNDSLGKKLDSAIESLKEDGTIDDIVKKWFGDIKH